MLCFLIKEYRRLKTGANLAGSLLVICPLHRKIGYQVIVQSNYAQGRNFLRVRMHVATFHGHDKDFHYSLKPTETETRIKYDSNLVPRTVRNTSIVRLEVRSDEMNEGSIINHDERT